MRKKLKYQGGITKFLCTKFAQWNKEKFVAAVRQKGIFDYNNSTSADFDIISFSGSASFEDQLLSIYTFVKHAGVPKEWTIYSDKSYNQEQKDIFTKLFPFVKILDWDVYNHIQDNKALTEYMATCHLAKKVNLIIGHPYKNQTIYLDSDVLFYKNIKFYLDSGLLNSGLWYAPDAFGNIGIRFKTRQTDMYALNSGFLLLNANFNRADIFTYFEELNGNYHYFSEQSSFEYAFRKQGAHTLDPRQFVVDSADQFDFSTRYHPDAIAMRHYTTPVRHKMWQNGWKWHLNS